MADPNSKQQAQKLVEQGAEALARRDFAGAVQALESALAIDPNHAEATRYLKFARMGAKQRARQPSNVAQGAGKETMPPEAFGVLKPRKKKPSVETPRPHVKAGGDDDGEGS